MEERKIIITVVNEILYDVEEIVREQRNKERF